ncbi:MAG: autotransporter-associated beta strand repeat-containing protein [Planctomycetes bacterium]|nr:autotransporter-associated beta strand repeat-containing protein [Planctomycetota bacterium]
MTVHRPLVPGSLSRSTSRWLVAAGLLCLAWLDQAATAASTRDFPVAIAPPGRDLALDIPQVVPVNSSQVTSTIPVGGINTPITKVVVSVTIRHSAPKDLELYVISPQPLFGNQVTVVVANQNGGRNRDPNLPPLTAFDPAIKTGYGRVTTDGANVVTNVFPVILDDDAPDVANNPNDDPVDFYAPLVDAPDPRAVIPPGLHRTTAKSAAGAVTKLSHFIGLRGDQVNGLWTLAIRHNNGAFPDFGQLVSWTLTISQESGYTWTGAGGTPNWSDAGNWLPTPGPTAIENGVSLFFPPDAARKVNINDINPVVAGDFGISQVVIEGDYSISLSGTQLIDYQNGMHFFCSLGNPIWNVPGRTHGAVAFTVDNALNTLLPPARLIVSGALNELNNTVTTTFAKDGNGTAVLTTANSIRGTTAITGGVLEIDDGGALGAAPPAGGAVTVGLLSTLQLANGITLNKVLNLTGLGAQDPTVPLLSDTPTIGALNGLVGTNLANGSVVLVTANTALGASAGTLTVAPAGTSTLTGIGLVKLGAGIVSIGRALPATNTQVDVEAGILQLTVANSIPDTSAVTVVGGTLQYMDVSDAIGSLNLTGGTVATGTGTLTLIAGSPLSLNPAATPSVFSGGLALPGITTFAVADGAAANDLDVQAVVSGAGGVVKSGPGLMQLGGANTYTGGTQVTDGTLLVNGSVVGAMAVSAGMLGGSGSVGALAATGGVIDPGNPGSPAVTGTLSCSSFVLGARSALVVDVVNGVADVLHANGGGNDLGNAVISARLTGTGGNSIPVVTTGGYGTTRFQGLPADTAGIAYVGNDVLLSCTSAVSFSASQYAVNKDAGSASITLVRTDTTTALDAGVALLEGSARITLDYGAPPSATAHFAVGAATATFTIPLIANLVADGDKDLFLYITPQTQTAAAPPASARLVIVDNSHHPSAAKRCGLGGGATVLILIMAALARGLLALRSRLRRR